jgi:hypothetical protein
VADASPRRRLGTLGRVDVAGLLEPFLARVASGLDAGRAEWVPEQLAAWEDALGEVVWTAPDQLAELERLSWFEAARRRFRTAEVYRENALAGLHAAILSGTLSRVTRWRWAGHSYGSAIQNFVAQAEERVERDERAGVLPRDASGRAVARYSVLASALGVHQHALSPAGREDVSRSLVAAHRGLDLMSEVQRHEAEREAAQARYRDLVQRARSTGLDPASLSRAEQAERVRARVQRLEHLLRQHADRSMRHRLDVLAERCREDLCRLDALLNSGRASTG